MGKEKQASVISTVTSAPAPAPATPVHGEGELLTVPPVVEDASAQAQTEGGTRLSDLLPDYLPLPPPYAEQALTIRDEFVLIAARFAPGGKPVPRWEATKAIRDLALTASYLAELVAGIGSGIGSEGTRKEDQ